MSERTVYMCCKNTNAKETHFGACCSRPDLYGIIIPGKHGKLLATLYSAGGEGPHPTVLLLHGIPGCEQNLDLAQAFRRAGFHVMTFHYSGSWGSSGNYSLQKSGSCTVSSSGRFFFCYFFLPGMLGQRRYFFF